MKKALKIILICLLILALIAGGVFAYFKFRKQKPCTVYPAMQWLMSYMPNQSYLYGIVTSDASQTVLQSSDRNVLEILVQPGQTVSIGDPLLRYDATRTQLEYEQKKLDLIKLENELRAQYKEYRKYAREEYAEPLLTPTPTPSPRPRGGEARSFGGARRLGARVYYDLSTPVGGDGSQGNPFTYEAGASEAVSNAFLQTLLATALEQGANIYVLIRQPDAEIAIVATPEGELSFAVTVRGDWGHADLSTPLRGNATEADPLVFAYGSGAQVSASFLSAQWEQAKNASRDWFVLLEAGRFTVPMVFGPDGSLTFRTTVQEPTPAPTDTPTPEPTDTPTPTPEPTETPEPTPTPYSGGGGWISREERERIVRELAASIRNNELKYRQYVLDLEKAERRGLEGYLYSEVNGTVMSVLDPQDANNGETLIEIRGGTGLHITAILAETELDNYPVGTELTGMSYQLGAQVTARVAKVGTMPISTNYSNGGNASSSGYLMVLDIVGDVMPSIGEYIEFSDFSSLYEQGTIYLHEAFLREIDGETCIFVVENDVLVKRAVQTGSRMDAYVELLGAPIGPEDRLAFPYDKNCKEGNSVEDAQSNYYFGW